jgi:molybdenum cofactor cytidylyltransferase
MGQAKALLRIAGETFLERAVGTRLAGGGDAVSVVVAAADERIIEAARSLGVSIVLNPDPSSEQIQSLRLALAALPDDAGAAAVLPVDAPRVSAATVRSVVDAGGSPGASAVVPHYRGRPGHPVLIARSLFPAILEEPLPEGLRSLLASGRAGVERVDVDDPGALEDIDTPDEYTSLREGSPI